MLVTFKVNKLSQFVMGQSIPSAPSPGVPDGGGGGGGGCFIATATYGSPLAEEVNIFKEYRDDVLLKYWWGREFIEFYYRHSPAIAEKIRANEPVKSVVRGILNPACKLVKLWLSVRSGTR